MSDRTDHGPDHGPEHGPDQGPARPASPDSTADDRTVDPALVRRRQAEGAAGDLARMGIDPRSLGLGGPDSGRSASGSATPDDGLDGGLDDGFDGGAAVLPLRPEFRQHPDQPPQSAPEQPVVVPAVVPPVPLPAQRPDTGRLLRSVARGLVTPDGAVAMQDERALVESVRTRQADRRIVTFVAGKGGVGCTTVAVAVGTTFVALREDRSVVVDVQQGTASLGSLLGAEHPTRVGELLVRHEVVEAPRAPSGLGVVDGADWDLGLSRSDVGGVLERLGRETTFNLLDAGDEAGEGAHTALARADQVVVVTGPGEVGAAALGSVVERVRRVNPAAAERLVTVVVCPDEESHRRTVRELGPASGVPASGPVVVVPPEPALRAGAPYDAAHVSGATREAVLRVAAHVATPDGPSGR